MAKVVARFEKVSFDQFINDINEQIKEGELTELIGKEDLNEMYESIVLPYRKTRGSAGHDFIAPFDIVIQPGQTIVIPTGIRCIIDTGYVLDLFPRSGQGFNYRLRLNNTVGIIDSDYFYSDNEGHIFAKLTNDSNENKTLIIPADTGFMQGIFVEYGITVDDDATEIRNGGFGSTTAK